EVSFLDGWRCTCPHHVKRHVDCKHITAVQKTVIDIRELESIQFEITKPEPTCSNNECRSTDCRYYDERKRKDGGVSVRYRCNKCKKRFTYRPGFLGRHYPDSVITDSINDAMGGKSCATAARDATRRINPSTEQGAPNQSTVWRWLKCARDATSKILQRIPVPTSGKWSTDEHYYSSKGKGMYEYGVMDMESRLMLSCDTSHKKLDYDATNLFKDAVSVAANVPAMLTSDKLRGFKKGFDAVIRSSWRKTFSGPIHNQSAGIRKIKTHNNRFERYNGTTKDRTKTARGFNSVDPPLLGLFITYYNFLRPHLSLNKKTPAEKIGIRITGHDKWATLLTFCATYCHI
ncbi:MAG: DDE-type integrase/transposase/recombinase, partial [Cenarchaeum sp. SB0678_bin_8]|nr:DDE-type integrase/transposase/recombinase [Cenarchaeum sp. SB0678_bin_8]